MALPGLIGFPRASVAGWLPPEAPFGLKSATMLYRQSNSI